jgi:hypothetical protein
MSTLHEYYEEIDEAVSVIVKTILENLRILHRRTHTSCKVSSYQSTAKMRVNSEVTHSVLSPKY